MISLIPDDIFANYPLLKCTMYLSNSQNTFTSTKMLRNILKITWKTSKLFWRASHPQIPPHMTSYYLITKGYIPNWVYTLRKGIYPFVGYIPLGCIPKQKGIHFCWVYTLQKVYPYKKAYLSQGYFSQFMKE